jgi:hypothetical protein
MFVSTSVAFWLQTVGRYNSGVVLVKPTQS